MTKIHKIVQNYSLCNLNVAHISPSKFSTVPQVYTTNWSDILLFAYSATI